jgi:hypothetical protein
LLELNFNGVDELITAIQEDLSYAREQLQGELAAEWRKADFFK